MFCRGFFTPYGYFVFGSEFIVWNVLTHSTIESGGFEVNKQLFNGVNQMVDSRYYTPQQACEILGTDDEQVLSWIHSGELAAVNVAKSLQGNRPRWRIAEVDLAKFLMARRHPASQQPAASSQACQEIPFA